MFDWFNGFRWGDDGSWILTVIVFVIGGLASLNLGFNYTEGRVLRRDRRKYLLVGRLASFTLFLVGYVVFSALAAFFSAFLTFDSDSPVPAATLSTHLGLQSDKAYPLIVSNRVGTSSAGASAGIVSFSAPTYVSTKPASAVLLSFSVGEKSWILKLPVAKVTFVRSETADPTVKLHLVGSSYDGHWTYHYGGYDCHFHNLLFVCPQERAGKTLHVKKSVDRKGLPPIINDYLDSATITLKPTMYKEILGTP